MYNICFIARRPFDNLSPAIFKDLKKNFDSDIHGVFITLDSKETAYIRQKFSGEDITICELSEYMNAHWDEFSMDALVAFEEKFRAKPLWKYIYTDRFLLNKDHDYVVHTTAGLFSFFEYVFTTYNIDFYYDEVIATLFTYVAYLVGKKTGAEYFTLFLMRAVGMDLTHHYVTNDPFEMMYDMPDNYLELSYSDEELQCADEFLKGFEEKHSKPLIMSIAGRKPKFKLSFLGLPLFYIRQRFFNKFTRDKGEYIYYKAYEHTLDPIKFYFRYQFSKKYYHKADLSKKFVYFPLHLQPEATTIVCAQKYEKQLYFIDNLAKSVPADTMIYVKEHYSFLGSRENEFYKTLKNYPNVVLIDPWEDSFALIEKSVCVATLTGTAGIEAMLLRHPVIMGGDIMYENAPGIMRIEDIFDNYVSAIEGYKQPDRQDIVKYLAAYFRSARPGNTYALSEARLEPENVAKLAESMYNYFQEKKPRN